MQIFAAKEKVLFKSFIPLSHFLLILWNEVLQKICPLFLRSLFSRRSLSFNELTNSSVIPMSPSLAKVLSALWASNSPGSTLAFTVGVTSVATKELVCPRISTCSSPNCLKSLSYLSKEVILNPTKKIWSHPGDLNMGKSHLHHVHSQRMLWFVLWHKK